MTAARVGIARTTGPDGLDQSMVLFACGAFRPAGPQSPIGGDRRLDFQFRVKRNGGVWLDCRDPPERVPIMTEGRTQINSLNRSNLPQLPDDARWIFGQARSLANEWSTGYTETDADGSGRRLEVF